MSRHLSKQRAHSLPLIIVFFLVGVAMASPAQSQDTLPSFRAVIRSGKVVLSWVNLSSRVIQLTIQRSSDSLQGFKSIAPMPDPSLTENGFMDMRAPDTRQYYRIYVQESGGYFFTTPSRRAIPESEAPQIIRARPIYIPPAPKYTPIVEVQEPVQQIPTLNTLTASGLRPIIAKRPPGRIRFAVQPIAVEIKELEVRIPNSLLSPSVFMLVNPDGNLQLALPSDRAANYRIQFYLPDGAPFFQVSRVKDPFLIIDKVNFLKSGWFEFEVYESERLRERKRIFIPKTRQ